MSGIAGIVERIRSFNIERTLGLRPPYPPVVLQLERNSISLIRLRPQRGKKPQLEALETLAVEDGCLPASIFEAHGPDLKALTPSIQAMFERTGTRLGKVSIVLPDNLAKITLISLPERPSSRRQLEELVKAQMRRAVPFRIDESRIAYQVIEGEGRGVSIFVALVRRNLVEPWEALMSATGNRVGLIDLCTPNLINLCRQEMLQAGAQGDIALLNSDPRYFSLAIMREGKLIFFRCKSYPAGVAENGGPNGALRRETANSISYYQERLDGKGITSLFVRSTYTPIDEITAKLSGLELGRLVEIDPFRALEPGGAPQPDLDMRRRFAPGIGAAIGRV